jgi:hypothetical protein
MVFELRIHAISYKTKLKEDMLFELEVTLKTVSPWLFLLRFNILTSHRWTINPHEDNSNPRDVNWSRVSQIMLQHMTLLPCTKYTQPVFVDSPKDRKGNGKAVDEVAWTRNQSEPMRRLGLVTSLEATRQSPLNKVQVIVFLGGFLVLARNCINDPTLLSYKYLRIIFCLCLLAESGIMVLRY